MIQHDAQVRHLVADLQYRLHQLHRGVCGVHYQPGIGDALQALDEARVRHLPGNIAAPYIAAANPQEHRVLAEAVEQLGEVRLFGLQVADGADEQGVGFHLLQHPQIVFHPGAGFQLDGSDNVQRLGIGPVGGRQRHAILLPGPFGGSRIGHALRPAGVEQMDMGVHDGNVVHRRLF